MNDSDFEVTEVDVPNEKEPLWKRYGKYSLEVALLVFLFFLMSPGVPGVNEPHYLCKAKQFWNPDFCRGDLFLESADAHYLFYFTLGLLTKFFSLSVSAWIGRLVCWVAIAMGWQYLIRCLTGQKFWSLPAAAIMLICLDYCHFAGEWLIGGVEAKGIAYALVFAGLGFLVQHRWGPVWLLFGLASAFHVLVGGWAVIAGLMAWLVSGGWRFGLKSQLMLGIAGFVIALFGLIPALVLTMGQDPEIVRMANEIYTFERIAHHLVFSHIVQTAPERLDFFLFAVIAWLGFQWVCWEFVRFRAFGMFIAATVLIAIAAIAIESWCLRTGRMDLAAGLLRYYWFRLADVFVPAGVAIGLVLVICKCMSLHYQSGAIVLALAGCLIVVHVSFKQITSAIQKRSQADALTLPTFPGMPVEFNRKIARDWIDACTWIRVKTPSDSRFITPRAQSTFKWYAHRSEVVAWKDVPQDAVGIVNWRNRFTEVFRPTTFRFGLATLDAERRLLDLGKKHRAQFLVIERRHVRERKRELEYRYRYQQFLLGRMVESTPFKKPLCLKQIYPDSSCTPEIRRESTYLVYELVIPDPYRPQLAALASMLGWYDELQERMRNQPWQ